MNKQRKKVFITTLITIIVSIVIVLIYQFSEDRISNKKYSEINEIEEEITNIKSMSPYDLMTDSISYEDAANYLQEKEDSLKCEFSNKFAELTDSEQRAYKQICLTKEEKNNEKIQKLQDAKAYIDSKYNE